MKKLFLFLTTLLLLTACNDDVAERVAKCEDASEPWLVEACGITGGIMPETCAEAVGQRPIESVEIVVYEPREDGAPYCLLVDKLCTYVYGDDAEGEFDDIMLITCADKGGE